MAVYTDFAELLQCLNTAKARYLLVGAHAVAIYTEPRYTKDMDIWVDPSPENAERVYKALKKYGAPVAHLKVSALCDPALVYQIGVEPVRIDIIMAISGLDFTAAWKNKRTTFFGKTKTFVLGKKELIKTKEATKRPQDKLDLAKLYKSRKLR